MLIDFLETHQLLLNEVANSKAVLIPSHYHTTGEFSMLEALMFKKPVVVFNCGIHKDIFIDKENGMISELGDLKGYYKKIEELNNNEELYNTVSLGARKLFEQLTSFKDFKSQILKNL